MEDITTIDLGPTVDEPITTRILRESYRIRALTKVYDLEYVTVSTQHEGGWDILDDHVRLSEMFTNKYETPREGVTAIPAGATKGHVMRGQPIRTVHRVYQGNNPVVLLQIEQWRDPEINIADLVKNVPDHARELLLLEYTNPGVKPYDLEMGDHMF